MNDVSKSLSAAARTICGAIIILCLLPTARSDEEAKNGELQRLSPQAARMHKIVTKPRDNELKWQEIPWLVDLDDAIRIANEEKRPILIFASGDEPLEKC